MSTKPSKMVTDRQKSALAVEAAAIAYAETAQAQLDGLLATELLADERFPDVALLMRLAARRIARHSASMVTTDEAHLDELENDLEPRRRRDEAATELRDRLLAVRRTMDGLYGPEQTAQLFALGGELSTDPVVLHRQAQRALARFRQPAAAVAAASPKLPGVVVESSTWVEVVEPAFGRLTEALRVVAFDRREAALTLLAKRSALRAHDETFGHLAAFLEAIFTAARLPDLAARVRPSGRRPGRTAEGDEDASGDGGEPAPPEPTLDPPAAPGA